MKEVHLECLPDETLVKILGIPKKLVKHHNDKGRVCKSLKKNINIIGIVDEDPGAPQPSYISELILVEPDSKHGLRVLTDLKRNNFLIIVCPRLEDWIINVTNRQQVKLQQFSLPNKSTELHRIINTRLESFKKLIEHLHEVNCESILHLKRLLND